MTNVDVLDTRQQAMSAVLYLDTETNGPLPPRSARPDASNCDAWPRMVQLAFQVVKGGVVVQQYTAHVMPDGEPFPAGWSTAAEAVNRITRAHLEAHGHSTTAALAALEDAIAYHDVVEVVAHNLEFDAGVVGAELVRKGRPADALWAHCAHTCTMRDGAFQTLYGTRKWKKLSVAYEALCGAPWDETDGALHDAATDVEVLKRMHEAARVRWGALTAAQVSTGRAALVVRRADVAATLTEFEAGTRSPGGLNLLKVEVAARRLRVTDIPGLSPGLSPSLSPS